jgi:hypothetical protein
MKTLLKFYSASCLIVVGFFTFFLIPWGLLPFSDTINIMVVGGGIVSLTAFYIAYLYRREGFELGWFLANRGGFWVITIGVLGLVIFFCGTLLFVSPNLFVPAFEQGALPFGVAIVSLFWLALIFMFAYLTFGMVARVTACVRMFLLVESLINALIALVCLGLSGVFFSLFLEVINDIAIRISVPVQWKAIWIFVGLLIAAGIIHGLREKPSYFLEEKGSVNAEAD